MLVKIINGCPNFACLSTARLLNVVGTSACHGLLESEIPAPPLRSQPSLPGISESVARFLLNLESQHSPDTIPHLLLILCSVVAPHFGSLNVGWALVIGLSQHAHDRDQNLLDTLNRAPSLRGMFIVIRVVARWVQD